MRWRLAVAAVVLQVLALGYMAGEREWIVRNGTPILLRTAPVDPSDPMRGEYLRLEYEISRVPRGRLAGELPRHFPQVWDGRRNPPREVYARLEPGENGIADLVELTDVEPASGLFIRGRAQNSYGRTVQVRYGIEALFMEQGSARKLEQLRTGEKAGVPLNVDVALGSSGTAVLRGFEWEPLGIILSFEREPGPPRPGSPPNAPPPQIVTRLKVELKNFGEQPLAIVDLPGGRSLRLVPDERWQDARFRWVGEGEPVPSIDGARVMVLRTGEGHIIPIDLTRPEWFVVSAEPSPQRRPVALRDVAEPWSASFRIEYMPPSRASVADLPNAELIRHGRLRSRAFNPTGGLD